MLMNEYMSSYSLIQLNNLGVYNYISNIVSSSYKYFNIIKSVFKKSIITSYSKGHLKFSCIYDFIPKLNIYRLNDKKPKIGLFIIETGNNINDEFITQAKSIFSNKCMMILSDVKTIIIKKDNLEYNEFNYIFISTSNLYS